MIHMQYCAAFVFVYRNPFDMDHEYLRNNFANQRALFQMTTFTYDDKEGVCRVDEETVDRLRFLKPGLKSVVAEKKRRALYQNMASSLQNGLHLSRLHRYIL